MTIYFNMIQVTDQYDIVPELFCAYPEITKVTESNIDILPLTVSESIKQSTNFTIFIQTEPEMHDNHIKHISQIKARPNSVFAVSGFNKDKNNDWQNRYVLNFSHLSMTARVNNIVSVTQGKKPFLGTLLLGGRSIIRSIIIHEIKQSGLLTNFLTSYFPRTTESVDSLLSHEKDLFYRDPLLFKLDNTEFNNIVFDINGFGNTCKPVTGCQYGQHRWISQVIPYDVYNSCYISVVAETEAHNNSFFLSEKLSKPLLLAQPFVMFNSYCSLEILKDLGFKTFSPWIDESYDTIEDNKNRAKAVAQSVIKFCRLTEAQRHQAINEMQSIVKHNQNLALNKKWLMKTIANEVINFSTN